MKLGRLFLWKVIYRGNQDWPWLLELGTNGWSEKCKTAKELPFFFKQSQGLCPDAQFLRNQPSFLTTKHAEVANMETYRVALICLTRCNIQFVCRYSRPFKVWTMYDLMCGGVKTILVSLIMICKETQNAKHQFVRSGLVHFTLKRRDNS